MVHFRSIIAIAILLFTMVGCSTVTIKHHAIGHQPPLCNQNVKEKIAVYWGTAWRTDQKDVLIREKYIEEGVDTFFNEDDCFETVLIARSIAGKDVMLATDTELISGGNAAGADKVFVFRVEELGPNLYLYLSPILWQTKNEVLLQVRVLNTKTGEVESDLSTQWMRGGPFTLHSASTLPTDLSGVLKAIFYGKTRKGDIL
jgi:hypothetical protein